MKTAAVGTQMRWLPQSWQAGERLVWAMGAHAASPRSQNLSGTYGPSRRKHEDARTIDGLTARLTRAIAPSAR